MFKLRSRLVLLNPVKVLRGPGVHAREVGLRAPRAPRHHPAQLPPVKIVIETCPKNICSQLWHPLVGVGIDTVEGAARVALAGVPVGLAGAEHRVQHVAAQRGVVGGARGLLPHAHIHLLQRRARRPAEIYRAPTWAMRKPSLELHFPNLFRLCSESFLSSG